MELKLDEAFHKDFEIEQEIPVHLQWFLQPDYNMTYMTGSFGKMLMQSKRSGDFQLRIYYIEIWQPTQFFFTYKAPMIEAYSSFTEALTFKLNDNRQSIAVRAGIPSVFLIPALPSKNYLPMPRQGAFSAFSIAAPLSQGDKFGNHRSIQALFTKYQPAFNQELADKAKVKVPLATNEPFFDTDFKPMILNK